MDAPQPALGLASAVAGFGRATLYAQAISKARSCAAAPMTSIESAMFWFTTERLRCARSAYACDSFHGRCDCRRLFVARRGKRE